MKRFLLPLITITLLASCGEKTEEHKFVTPIVSSFRVDSTGDLVLMGKGFKALKDMDLDYDFSITMNDAIGESSLIGQGKKYKLSGDTAMIISPADIDGQFLIRDAKFSPAVKAVLDKNGTSKQTFKLKKENVQPIMSELSRDKDGYTLWVNMKDRTKTFWEQSDPKRGFTQFAHYEIYSYSKEKQQEFNEPVLYWKKFVKE